MSNPVRPDGLVAVVDETVIEQAGGITYILAACLLDEVQAARSDIRAMVADRTRRFHWIRERPRHA